MQVLQLIIQRVSINVMDDLARLRSGHFAVLPVFPVSRLNAWSAKPLRVKGATMRLVRPLGHGGCRYGHNKVNNRTGDFVAAPHVLASRQAFHFFCVRIQRVAVPVPHLVMPHAHIASSNGPVAMQALATNIFSAPLVFGSPMLLNPLVVHEAKAVCRMFPAAVFDRAKNHKRFPVVCTNYNCYKALGNSWAAPCISWIGRRIDEAHNINTLRKT